MGEVRGMTDIGSKLIHSVSHFSTVICNHVSIKRPHFKEQQTHVEHGHFNKCCWNPHSTEAHWSLDWCFREWPLFWVSDTNTISPSRLKKGQRHLKKLGFKAWKSDQWHVWKCADLATVTNITEKTDGKAANGERSRFPSVLARQCCERAPTLITNNGSNIRTHTHTHWYEEQAGCEQPSLDRDAPRTAPGLHRPAERKDLNWAYGNSLHFCSLEWNVNVLGRFAASANVCATLS